MRPRPSEDLPARYVRGAHRRAALEAAGVTDAELRGPLWVPAAQGLWRWSATDPAEPRQRILRAAALLDGRGAIGGWAAAFLHGATDLNGFLPDGEPGPVLLCLRPDQRCRQRGVTLIRSRLDPDDVVDVEGIPVTSLVRTCADLARLAPPGRTGPARTRRRPVSRRDLSPARLVDRVAAVDALRAATGVDVGNVLGYLDDRPRWQGTRLARAVVDLSEPNTRSPAESRFRMLWIGDAGLPRPRVNQPVRARSGEIVAEADLLDAGAGLVGEYDGEVHAGAQRRAADLVRAERLERLNLRVIRVTAVDLGEHRDRTVRRLRAAYARGLARDRSRDGWELA